jgi:hypothetical protein
VITTPPKNIVTASSTITIPLRCVASDTGTYRATLRVVTDGNPSTVDMQLLATVGTATSVHEDFAAMGTVSVWPNPASTSFSVQVGAPCRAMLVNSVGAMVGSWTIEAGTTKLDVDDLPKGAYRLVLTHGLGIRAIGLIVE